MSGSQSDILSAVGGKLGNVAQFLLDVDSKTYDRLFTVLWLIFVTLLLIATVDYGRRTRLVPLVIGIPTLLLLILLLTSQLSSGADTLIPGGLMSDRSGITSQFESIDDQADEIAEQEQSEDSLDRANVLSISLWILLLFSLIYVLGFLAGILVYLPLAYRIKAEQTWVQAVGYSVVIWLLIVLIFVYVLRTPLYEGIIVDTLI